MSFRVDLTSPARSGLCTQWCPVCQLWCRDATTVAHAGTVEHVRGLIAMDVDVWV